MTKERRSSKRLSGTFEGGWDGASGLRDCRITDLSAGGCFIDAYASNPVGTRVTIVVRLSEQEFRLNSEVVYVDRVQGFAVRFLDDNDPKMLRSLHDLITALTN